MKHVLCCVIQTAENRLVLNPRPGFFFFRNAVVAYLVEWALDSTFSDGWNSTVSLLSGGAPFHKVGG